MAARKYKRAPIKEALCAFNFTPVSEWNFTVPGKLLSVIQEEYPGEPRNIAIQTILPPVGGGQIPNIGFQNEIRVQIPSLDNTKIVVVGKDMISLSVLQPYEGWEQFKPRIERVISAYYKVNPPKEVIRIGIRYINHISVPQARANAGEYFNVVPEMKSSEDSDVSVFHLTNFMHRSEYATNDAVKVIVTNAGLITPHPDRSEYVLDIDTIWDETPLQDLAQVMEVVDKLHTMEGGVFEGMITDKARSLFDGD